ncbi:MAG: glycosyltransferase [Candidatus Woesearchaeota archaeon]|jgi:glycosyltransferase EpsE|nr:glycosyltransferase [Candidatus Woesearchaeota archaeon]
MKKENNSPIISVVMPVYNSGKFLEKAIKSILNQTYKNFEFIIIDDSSKDKSQSIIQKYKKQDKRIKFYKTKRNSGCTHALNIGLTYAKGKYIARMDADDISIKTRFEKQLNFIQKNDLDVCGTNIDMINFQGINMGKRDYISNIKRSIKYESPFAHPTVMFKRDLIIKYGPYDERYRVSQDYDLWLRFFANHAKFGVLNEYLLKYRIHPESTTKYKKLKTTIRTVLKIQKNAKSNYNVKFGFLGNLSILFKHFLLLLPNRLILFLFELYLKIKRMMKWF